MHPPSEIYLQQCHALHEAQYLNEVTLGIKALPEKQTVANEIIHHYETKELLLCLQWPAMGSHSKSLEASHILTTYYSYNTHFSNTGCGKLTSFFIWHFIFKKGS
jgi:hypothetical protein